MSSTDLQAIADGLPPLLHDEVRMRLARFVASAHAAGRSSDRDADLVRVFIASPFVAEIAIRRPAEFLDLIETERVANARSDDHYATLVANALGDCVDVASAKSSLRRLRQLEIARIAWRDIHLGVDLVIIMRELSDFAAAVIRAAVAWLHAHFAARFGRALDQHGEPLELLVIGMGKLGGHELNFSSDIDLIFVYGGSGTTTGGRKAVSHQDYFDRIGREFIALLNETTADGYVFRVDMRLRPFGDSGPLSTSLGALEHYYAVHGRDWERYAAIKARAISGDSASRNGLESITRPFVYRRYLDFGALEALREMKQMINREARSSALMDDIKRGPGGIREIEFTGQLLQLIRGGRDPRLRQQSLLPTLGVCRELGLLADGDVAALLAAYRFLRTTEHRLQQVNDWQTHALPADALNRARLASAMGFPGWSEFCVQLELHRARTKALFGALLASPDDAVERDQTTFWRELWLGPDDPQSLQQQARNGGHELNPVQLEVLGELKSARFQNRLTRDGHLRLDRLMPTFLESAERRALSDNGMKQMARLLHTIARRSVYLAFLADNPSALERLLLLFDASSWIAAQIIAQPILLDELLDQQVLFSLPDVDRLRQIITTQVRPQDGLEQAMENLRGFHNQQVLRVAASDVAGQFPVAQVSDQLTAIAEVCISAALEVARGEMVARFGEPECDDGNGPRRVGFAIVGYGKLGGWELGYGSDLDLVFLNDSLGDARYTNGQRKIENEIFFNRLAQRFIHILATTTPSGRAYEIDTRLRPSGSAGMLVCSTHAFMTYLSNDAWVWEHQALVRARGVAGDAAVLERFADIRREVLSRARDESTLQHEIAAMRRRMLDQRDHSNEQAFDLKHGEGGMTDIEFMVQYAVLRGACAHPSLLVWTDNLRLLETIAALELLPGEACRRLHEAYFAYRAEIHRCSLQQLESLADNDKFHDHRRHVIEIWRSLFD